MSHTIVYNRQFLKIDNKIIPLALYGSNNCTEYHNGRERCEREWWSMYFNGQNQMITATEKEILNTIQNHTGGEYQQHFIKNSKWIDDKGLIRFFNDGIKNAKTIEELKDEYYFTGLNGYFSIWKGFDNTIENRVSIYNSNDLREFLVDSQDRINKAIQESVYVCLHYMNEEFKSKTVKEKNKPERLTDYFAIKVANDYYLTQLTARRIKYTTLCCLTKQFETEKKANKYLEKLIAKGFNITLAVEHIIEFA